ncbi:MULTISPECIES: barstar family protein [unclassified Butyrivibrio]|uniref:barstar family protein n=1 Tax=unclassified Butyrivibrio TaxID=2639466 RepID=UPI0003B76965|nr:MULTISPECIES: barstar family protein [unclassified Butyrivibrio]MDC7293620.1 barstar family protein [Butyrivibrio sp. DSM 10294]
MQEKVFYIDMSEVTTKDELQDLLAKELPLPDYYGRNLDALHDILTESAEGWNIIFYNTTIAARLLGKYYNALTRLAEESCEETDQLKIRFYP